MSKTDNPGLGQFTSRFTPIPFVSAQRCLRPAMRSRAEPGFRRPRLSAAEHSAKLCADKTFVPSSFDAFKNRPCGIAL